MDKDKLISKMALQYAQLNVSYLELQVAYEELKEKEQNTKEPMAKEPRDLKAKTPPPKSA